MKTIRVYYFAKMREEAGRESESIETNSKNIGDLYEELKQKYQFSLKESDLRVAKNEFYSSLDTNLENGDEVAFIPPVAGG